MMVELFEKVKGHAKKTTRIDWYLFLSVVFIIMAGLVTMSSFTGRNTFFDKQLIWAGISFVVFFALSFVDFHFLRRTNIVTALFALACGMLLALFVVGKISKGAQAWFSFGLFAIQPGEFAKLVIVLVLAKYFSRRHVEIAHIRHIIISGVYAFIIFGLVLLQPDFGGALIIFLIWFGMVMVSGISKKHLLLVFIVGFASFALLWGTVLHPYQKARIMTFIHPLANIRGAGYNAYQSMVTVGSGQFFGKGIGFGTQSRLQFLPEYQTDFIFAAFSEEWGFVGVIILFILYGIVIARILHNAKQGETNFEILYGLGLAILLMSQFCIHIGMNIGILPVTGLTLPFMSYGGSHLLTSFIGLGILMGMRQYSHAAHKDLMKNEFLGY